MKNSKLIDLRVDLELTQEQLATEAGVAESTIQRAERGDPIRLIQQSRIVKALVRRGAKDIDRVSVFGPYPGEKAEAS